EILAKVERIKAVAQRHRVPVKAAALRFALAHPASAAVIPGASRPERIAEDRAALAAVIPDDFWRDLRDQKLVAAGAPLPIDRRDSPSHRTGQGMAIFRVQDDGVLDYRGEGH